MLIRMTENKMQDFDFSKPFSIEPSIYIGDGFNIVTLYLGYGKYSTPLYSCITYNKEDSHMLIDFLSFVGKETIINILTKAGKGERMANLVGVIDDVIKSSISKADADTLQECYERYERVYRMFKENGHEPNPQLSYSFSVYNKRVKDCLEKLEGKKNDTDSVSS